jgi:hypothetical protein
MSSVYWVRRHANALDIIIIHVITYISSHVNIRWYFLASSSGLLIGDGTRNANGISYVRDKSASAWNTVVAFYPWVIVGVAFIFLQGRRWFKELLNLGEYHD